MIKMTRRTLATILCLVFLAGCGKDTEVISDLSERNANLIVVFLESKGIPATKTRSSSGGMIGGDNSGPKFSVQVPTKQAVTAMAVLNANGLPQQQGTNLLDLFAKQGLMSSDREEMIRYQAGLAQQITNTILMIDGVIDASLQLSFPPQSTAPGESPTSTKITAAVYVKHQGVIDDPNSHLEMKIKRIVSGSVTGLDLNDVTVVSDWSRFTDVKPSLDSASFASSPEDYVQIWSIILSKSSAHRFRSLFFSLLFFAIVFALCTGWMIWKFYPILRHTGMKNFFNPAPLSAPDQSSEEE